MGWFTSFYKKENVSDWIFKTAVCRLITKIPPSTLLIYFSKKLSKEKCATLVRKNFLTNRVVYQWNALDEETISAPNINIFKNRLDQNLKDINIHLVHYL